MAVSFLPLQLYKILICVCVCALACLLVCLRVYAWCVQIACKQNLAFSREKVNPTCSFHLILKVKKRKHLKGKLLTKNKKPRNVINFFGVGSGLFLTRYFFLICLEQIHHFDLTQRETVHYAAMIICTHWRPAVGIADRIIMGEGYYHSVFYLITLK